MNIKNNNRFSNITKNYLIKELLKYAIYPIHKKKIQNTKRNTEYSHYNYFLTGFQDPYL